MDEKLKNNENEAQIISMKILLDTIAEAFT
jgi:hypothetical protein